MDMTLNNPCWKMLAVPWKKTEAEDSAVAATA
jgi:hypothetical protein